MGNVTREKEGQDTLTVDALERTLDWPHTDCGKVQHPFRDIIANQGQTEGACKGRVEFLEILQIDFFLQKWSSESQKFHD